MAHGGVIRRRVRRWVTIAAFAIALTAGIAVPALRAHAQTHSPVPVDVTFSGRSMPIPPSFFGLSIEYTELADFEQLGPAFDNVIAMLRPGDGSPMLLRLGGRSADQVVWMAKPPATLASDPDPYATPSLPDVPRWVRVLSRPWLGELAGLVRRDDLHVEPELNLAVHSPAMAVAFTRALRAALPLGTLAGVAIGNEPDLYRKQPWLAKERVASTIAATSAHWTVNYSAVKYEQDYVTYARALRRAIPGIPLDAPDITHPSALWPQTLFRLGRLAPDSISVHRYATATCKTHEIHVPSPLSFLQDRYTHGLAKTLTAEIALVKAHHLGLRVTEMNSFTCGGRKQIAESFATALWAPDAIFEMLKAGVAGISWHIHPELPNAPFHVRASGIVPLPELYGLAVFAQMIGPRPQLEQIRVSDTLKKTVKVWSVRSTEGLKVLALDKGSEPVLVRVHAPDAAGTARLARLMAPTLAAETGVTFGGRWIGSDGLWHGPRIEAPIADQQGVYAFRLAAYTGAVLTVGQ